jgi:hypothetical protein
LLILSPGSLFSAGGDLLKPSNDMSSPSFFSETGRLNMNLVGRWANGMCYTVALMGDTAFFGNGGYLEIVDFSIPSAPVQIGRTTLPDFVYDIALSDSFACISTFRSICVVDVSDLTHPSLVGSYQTGIGTLNRGLDADYPYVYVTGDQLSLRVINISNPTNPILVGSYDTPNHARDVVVQDGFAYLANREGGLRILSVSNPRNPIEIGVYSSVFSTYDVTVAGNYAYLADSWDGLRIIDITTPVNPVEIGRYDTKGTVLGVMVQGDYAYVADQAYGLCVIDISAPASPTEVGLYNTDGTAVQVELNGDHAYVADSDKGLRVIDISTPAAPTEAGFFDTGSITRGVAAEGNYAYITTHDDGFQVLDVSNPANPVVVGQYDMDRMTHRVIIRDQFAFATDNMGLTIFSILTPDSPSEISFIDIPSLADEVTVDSSRAYVTNEEGLSIIDVSNPWSPVTLGYYITTGVAKGLDVEGDYVYVANSNYGLSVIDVSDPDNPNKVGFYEVPGANDIKVIGNLGYLADSFRGLLLLDVSDPANPFEIDQLFSGSSQVLTIQEDYIYTGNITGVYVLDISNDMDDPLVGFYHTGSSAMDVSVVGKYVYVANGRDGLYILEFDETPITMISSFSAAYTGVGILLQWSISTDEMISGFRFLRKLVGGSSTYVPPDRLISSGASSYIDNDIKPYESYEYTLFVVKADGSEIMSQTLSVKTQALTLVLYQNYPNPFNPSTTISFTLAENSPVNLTVYGVNGNVIKVLKNGIFPPGYYEVLWDGKDTNGSPVSSGVYFYRMNAGDKVLAKKMVLLK